MGIYAPLWQWMNAWVRDSGAADAQKNISLLCRPGNSDLRLCGPIDLGPNGACTRLKQPPRRPSLYLSLPTPCVRLLARFSSFRNTILLSYGLSVNDLQNSLDLNDNTSRHHTLH